MMSTDAIIGAVAAAVVLIIVNAFGKGFFGDWLMKPKEQEDRVIEALVSLVTASSQAQIERDKAVWETVLQMARGIASLTTQIGGSRKDWQDYFVAMRDMMSAAADRDQRLMIKLDEVHDLIKVLVAVLRENQEREDGKAGQADG